MTEQPETTWFLIVYDNDAGKQVSMTTFTDDDEAVEAYDRVEAEHLWNPRMEVVLLGADSEEHIRVTHSRYFHEGKFTLEDFRARVDDILTKGRELAAQA